MNIDERLEALTRTAEAHDRQIEALLSLAAKHDSEIAALRKLWNDVAEGIGRLVHTAELQQNRLDSHSDRLDNLEST
jgi:chromosome segregation ATPase